MSQVDNYQFPPGTISGEAVLTRIENVFGAVGSGNLGASAPSNPFNGMTWIDTSEAPVWTKRIFTSEGWRPLTAVNITTGAVTPYIGDEPAERQSSPTDTTPGRLPILHDIGGGVGAIGGGIIQGGVLREIVVIPYDVDAGILPTGFTKDSAGQVTWDTTAFSWLKFVIADVWAGGAGSRRATQTGSTPGVAAGSGAGGFRRSKMLALADLSSSETITIGAGGTGQTSNSSTAPTVGGSSSFGSHITATSGTIGASNEGNNVAPEGGSGGSGSGDAMLAIDGGGGGGGLTVDGNSRFGGYGGAAAFSTSSSGRFSGNSLNAFAGKFPGGGAAGGTAGANLSNSNGADGGDGLVIVYLYG